MSGSSKNPVFNHPFYQHTTGEKSSAAKKLSAAKLLSAANAGDTEGNYVPGQINIFTGKPLPKISELPPVGVIRKPSSAAGLQRTSLTNKYTGPLTSGNRPIRATSISPARPQNGGSRRRTVHRKHKSYRKSKRVRHTRRKQTRRHRHRR
jgi:hypothetical protein